MTCNSSIGRGRYGATRRSEETLRHTQRSNSSICPIGGRRINNINSELRFTLESLNFYEHVYTVFGESTLGENSPLIMTESELFMTTPILCISETLFSNNGLRLQLIHEAIQSGSNYLLSKFENWEG